MSESAALAEQLHNALTSRTVIDQAIGILLGQQKCTPAEAFDLLRRASQGRNVKLRDIAGEMVGRYHNQGTTTGVRPESRRRDGSGGDAHRTATAQGGGSRCVGRG